ncbi:hypothetical protein HHK36_016340 [Tetracentron sinense]|uniref:C2H2-type domain-containing protein n=1 Tax=Tetracentron sinense TaxID=13715 RepID=A0A834YX07_TETSI|nr:hypothetical protein HHK36_016340 [Tetracentron sinense]
MEQAQYWMWTKRKHALRSHLQASTNASYNDSWEEQAFAEDASGPLGGFIWPPRSYSCSFCRREFRSAQALGGHMNVHRRDRARLKQSSSPHNETLHYHPQNHHGHIQNPCTSLGVQYPSQVCTLVYNPNPNSNPSVFASHLSPSRVSAPSTQENCSEQTLVSPYSSSIVQEHCKGSLFSPPASWSDAVAVRVLKISDSKSEGEKNSMIRESGCQVQGDCVKPDLSVSLNFLLRRARSGVEDEEATICKRQRGDASSLDFFLKTNSFDRHHLQSEVLGLSHIPMEDLDLELRLGDRPKAK